MSKKQKKQFDRNSGKLLKQESYNYSKFFLPFILALTAIVFANTPGNDFIDNWDDQAYIIDNEIIKHLNWESLKILFSTFYESNYHPLTLLSYAIEYKFFGLNPFYFHLTNYIFHLLNTLLVYLFMKRFTSKLSVAAITSLFFGIHPMHVESVAWISERKDVLYAFFFLLSLHSYSKYLLTGEKKTYILCFFWFFLSVLSKPAAVCLPLVLVLMDYYHHKKVLWKTLSAKIPFFAIALLFGIVAVGAQSSGAIQNIAPIFSIFDRIFLVSYSTVYYIFNVFTPFNLCTLHYYPIKLGNMLPIKYYFALPTLLLLVWGVFKSGRFKQELIFGLLFYLITIVLVLQILPVGRAIVSERYSYIPHIGVFFIFGQFFSYIKDDKFSFSNRVKPTVFFVLVMLTVLYSFLTYERNKVWKNGIVLFTNVIEKYPEEGYGWSARAYSKNEKGDPDGAITDYDKAIELAPKNHEFYFNRGNVYIGIGKFEKAIADYSTAIQFKPDYAAAFSNRGLSFLNLNRPEEALRDFNKAIALNPKFIDAYFNRGNVFYETRKFEKAIIDYTVVTELNPNYADAYYNRGISNFNLNKEKEACNDWQKAHQLGHIEANAALEMYCK